MRHVAIFDLDGTLIDSAPAITRALNVLRDAHGLSALDAVQVRRWISLGAASLIGRALGLAGDADTHTIAAFRTHYAEQPSSSDDVYPGTTLALRVLHGAGVAMAVCTNKPQTLSERVLTQSGLSDYFQAVLGGDTVQCCKPDPAHVIDTLVAMGCEGSAFDFIGDSHVDAAAAKASGGRFLWASWGYADTAPLAPPERTLSHPSDIPDAVLAGTRA